MKARKDPLDTADSSPYDYGQNGNSKPLSKCPIDFPSRGQIQIVKNKVCPYRRLTSFGK